MSKGNGGRSLPVRVLPGQIQDLLLMLEYEVAMAGVERQIASGHPNIWRLERVGRLPRMPTQRMRQRRDGWACGCLAG